MARDAGLDAALAEQATAVAARRGERRTCLQPRILRESNAATASRGKNLKLAGVHGTKSASPSARVRASAALALKVGRGVAGNRRPTAGRGLRPWAAHDDNPTRRVARLGHDHASAAPIHAP
jgi:hypothetical protein